MSDSVFVVESISDGPSGYPYDEILSIAVCKVDLDQKDFETVFSEVVLKEPKYIGKQKLDYAERKGLNVIDLYRGTPLEDIVQGFMKIVNGNYVTSYDIRQEFTKYLCNNPWDVTGAVTIMPSIMMRQPVAFRCKYPENEPDVIVKTYKKTFRNDPLNVGDKRGALELAQMASMIAISLRERGKY